MYLYYEKVTLNDEFLVEEIEIVCTNCNKKMTENDIKSKEMFIPNDEFNDIKSYEKNTLYINPEMELGCIHCGNIHDEEENGIRNFVPLYNKKKCYENIEFWKDVAEIRKYGKIISKPDPKPKYIPKCPACQSPNLRRIGGLERAGSTAMFGWFSKKRDKTFECKDCGMMF